MRHLFALPCGSGTLGGLLVFLALTDPASGQENRHVPKDGLGDALPDGALARLGTTRLRHQAYVVSLAFSPDGKILASGSYDFHVSLWDAKTGRRLFRLSTGSYAYALAFSPNGRYLAATAGNGNDIQFWDITSGQERGKLADDQQAAPPLGKQKAVRPHAHQSSVSALRFRRDGQILASGSYDGSVRVWQMAWPAGPNDPVSGRLLRELRPGGKVSALDFSPDGKKLISAGDEGQEITLWDVGSGEKLSRFSHGETGITSVSFSSDGKTIASGTRYSVWVRDTVSGKGFKLAKAGTPVAFAPDGRTLATGEWENDVHLWNAATGQELHVLRGHGSLISSLAFSPDGKTLASGSYDGSVRLWHAGSGEEQALPGHRYAVNAVAVSPDGRLIATRGGDGILRLWGALTAEPLRSIPLATSPSYGHNLWSGLGTAHLVFSSDGRTMVTAGAVWDVATGKKSLELQGADGPLALSPDGSLLASAGDRYSRNSGAVIWDLAHGRMIRQIEPQQKNSYDAQLTALAFSPDGKLLATGSHSGRSSPDRGPASETIHLWESGTGKLRRKLGVSHRSPTALLFSPDGETLFSAGDGVRAWKVATGKELAHYPTDKQQHGRATTDPLALSSDGRLLAHAGPGTAIVIREVLSGKPVRTLQGHEQPINSLAFFPDGRRLISGSADNTALVWDLAPERSDLAELAQNLDRKELDALWHRLGATDAHQAYRTLWTLVLAPEKAVTLFTELLQPMPTPDMRRVPQWLAELDHANFQVRKSAEAELRKLGPAVEETLYDALKGKISLEAARRIELILASIQREPFPPEVLRQKRAVHVLELIGTPDVDPILQRLTRDAGPARREVEDTLRRLRIRRQDRVPPPLTRKASALPIAAAPRVLTGHNREITSLAFSPDGKTLVSAALDGSVRVWDAQAAKHLQTRTTDEPDLYAVAVAAHGKMVAAGGLHIFAWDSDTAGQPRKLAGHIDKVACLALSRDGSVLASGSYSGGIRVWDFAKGESRHAFTGHKGRVLSIGISPDGKTLVSGGLELSKTYFAKVPVPMLFPEAVRLWSLQTAKPLKEFADHGPIAVFAPDGRTLAWSTLTMLHHVGENRIVIGGRETQVGTVDWNEVKIRAHDSLIVWDQAEGRIVWQLDSLGDLLAFSPDGRLLAVARGSGLHLDSLKKLPPIYPGDGRLRLIEVDSGKEVLSFPKEQRVTALAFAPDGRTLATGGGDGKINLWNLETDEDAAQLTAKDLERLWNDLAGEDAVLAYRAFWALRRHPAQAVALLKERLPSLPADDPRLLASIADLDCDDFTRRETAQRALQSRGAAAEPALLKALSRPASALQRQQLLNLLASPELSEYPDVVGRRRAVALLETIRSDEAIQLLKSLAAAAPFARQTRDARLALDRLTLDRPQRK